MREAAFIRQNKDKWAAFENALIDKGLLHPDELSDLYIEITDHLSYAKTFYPGSNTQIYLNSLASQAHQKIYKTKRESRNRIVHFWKTEFPIMFKHHHRETARFIFGICLFCGSWGIFLGQRGGFCEVHFGQRVCEHDLGKY